MNIKLHKLVKPNNLQQRKLSIEISGKNVNYIFINSIRRISKLYIPTYVFYIFNIEKNTSIFDNDAMILRLKNIVPQNLKVDIDFLDPIYYVDVKWENENRQKHEKDNIEYTMHINAKNNTEDNYINVTTNDVNFYLNKKLINVEIKYPILITQLKKGQEFTCTCKAVLGASFKSYIDGELWAASGNTYFEQLANDKYILTLESKGQFSEIDILFKCCKLAYIKLDNFKKILTNHLAKNNDSDKLEFELDEDEAILSVICDQIKNINQDNLNYTSCTRKNILSEIVTLTVYVKKNNVIKITLEAINKTFEIYKDFENSLKKLKL